MSDSLPIPPVRKVRIADGCIVCNLCEDTCPDVFEVRADTCVIRPLASDHFTDQSSQIWTAAEECPVDVIIVTGDSDME